MTLPIEIIRIDRQGEEILGITIALKPLLDRIRELEQERNLWKAIAEKNIRFFYDVTGEPVDVDTINKPE